MADNVKGTPIYDLGREHHIEYAKSHTPGNIPPEVEASKRTGLPEITSLETKPTEFEQSFGFPNPKASRTAHFSPPQGSTYTAIFGDSLIPSLGGTKESYQAWAQSIEKMQELLAQPKEKIVHFFKEITHLEKMKEECSKQQRRYFKG